MSGPWQRALRSGAVWLFLLVVLPFGLAAALAPRLAPHDPYHMGIGRINLPPAWVQDIPIPGMAEHPLGTDRFGRDVLSRLLYGARTAFFLALAAVSLAAITGALVGLLAGYLGGRLDAGLLFVSDLTQAIPGIMLVVMIVLIFRTRLAPTWANGLLTLVVGFTAYSWAGLARLVRVNVLLVKNQPFVEAARALGASPWHIICRHLLPNVQHVILVWIVNAIPAVILLEAVLGYIGVGITSALTDEGFTVLSWGGMFFSGRSALNRNPWMLVIPSLCILLLSLSFILLGDFLKGLSRRE